MEKLSKMQQKIYDYLVSCIREQGYPPSVREIGEAVGLKSPSTVHFHLKHLEEAKYIEKGAGKGRAIALTHPVQGTAADLPASAEEELPLGKIPIVGNVAAGSPILAQECVEDYLTFDPDGPVDEYFALHVGGDGDGAKLARLGDDLSFLLVVLGIQNVVRDALLAQKPG